FYKGIFIHMTVWVNRAKADYYSSSLAKIRLAQDASCNCGHTIIKIGQFLVGYKLGNFESQAMIMLRSSQHEAKNI
ncbi:unnamed protein product, partial [Heterotrigona itama]